jgi:hypothetical protein
MAGMLHLQRSSNVRRAGCRADFEEKAMETTTLLAIEERSRHTRIAVGFALWVAGATVAGAIAWRFDHPFVYDTRTDVANRQQASTMEWAVESTDDPVVVDGTLVMPEDMIVGHRPPAGVTMMQTP